MYKVISLLLLLSSVAISGSIDDINCSKNSLGYALSVNGDQAQLWSDGQSLMTWLNPRHAWDGHMVGSWSGTDLMIYFENHYGTLRNVRAIATIPSNDGITGVMVINAFWPECNRNP